MDEDDWRGLMATDAAHAFMIETLFRMELQRRSDDQIDQLANAIKTAAANNDDLTGVARGNERRAEMLADVMVQMQEHVSNLVDSAVAAVKAARKADG